MLEDTLKEPLAVTVDAAVHACIKQECDNWAALRDGWRVAAAYGSRGGAASSSVRRSQLRELFITTTAVDLVICKAVEVMMR